MIARSLRGAALALTVALALGACASDGSRPGAGGAGGTPVGGSAASPSPAGSSSPGGAGSPSGAPSSTTTPADLYTSPGASPAPFPTPWTPELPVDATIAPSCVRPGGTLTITVKTVPKAGVAYHAIYAGTKGGAPPPFGSGYGGNDKGFSNGEGVFRSSWVVSPQAPAGPARADVIVGYDEKWGYDDPPFRVADASGRC